MNKGDIITLTIFNITQIILMIEYLVFKLETALPILIIWTIISLVVHIFTLKNYAINITYEEVQE